MNYVRYQTLVNEARPHRRSGRLNRRQAAQLLAGIGLAGAGAATLGIRQLGGRAVAAGAGTAPARHAGRMQHEMGTPAADGPALGEQPDGSYAWRVQVAGMDMEHELDLQAFFPTMLTINAGDTVYFALPEMPGFHTVTFLSGEEPPPLLVPETDGEPAASPAAGAPRLMINPALVLPAGGPTYDGTGYVNSGLDIFRQPGDPPVAITFTEPGSYEYLCVPHGLVMRGTIVVQAAGSARPEDQAAVDARADAERAALVAEGLEVIAQYAEPVTTEREDGTTLWEISAGAGDGQARVMRFLPGVLEINAGDTVRWINRSAGEPHNVTFLGAGVAPLEGLLVEPQADGPPKLIENPETQLPQGGDVYRGEGLFQSGTIGSVAPGGPSFGGRDPYELTFDTPGEYPYYCRFHASGPEGPGMFGRIIVR